MWRLAALLLALRGVSGAAPKTAERRTAERVAQFGESVRKRLGPYFQRAGVAYPPSKILFLGLKSERRLEMYAAGPDGSFKFIRSYPFTAASGELGPKLRQGDKQVPEGVYRVESLNPDSRFHLALKVGYPNEFDMKRGIADGRSARVERDGKVAYDHRPLGDLIMIHGDKVSIGCIAIGNHFIEEVFVATAETGYERAIVIISPVDPRTQAMPAIASPPWVRSLYAQLSRDVRALLPSPR